MAMAISMECGLRCDDRRARTRRKSVHHIRGRLAAFALAAAVLALMAYGQHWLLQQAPAAASELAMATYAVDALSGGAAATDARVNDTEPNGRDVAR
jgi:hypothetical protein